MAGKAGRPGEEGALAEKTIFLFLNTVKRALLTAATRHLPVVGDPLNLPMTFTDFTVPVDTTVTMTSASPGTWY